MIKLLLLILPFYLYGSKILSYNIYDRTDRVDIMITFDTPYEGVIKQSISDSTITIKLEDASIESSKIKQLSSKYIKAVSITPMQDYTQVVAQVPPSVSLQASKTSDAYGLRLRFTALSSSDENTKEFKDSETPLLNSLPTKKSEDISMSYYVVVTILILLVIILFYIKNRVSSPKGKNELSSWLFKEDKDEKKEILQQTSDAKSVSIRFQKSLNSENSVVLLDFAQQSYLVLMGKNNILLDKFTDNKPVTEDDFNFILQNRHKELDKFLNNENEQKEPIQSYKEKAASILYEV
ncbi:MAG: hypothetical protein A2513_04805 [Sulfurimonas sp. RIFOXYD12_FULL_33_39]|uniref:hypothetical protein n=1 Tax=unclassified Sulfurimonas TaxID=2623549 RepID=UPI0008CBD7C7|nr:MULTISPECIES: hypothetical protein [unclassified Sulfurimonas]OHE09446.1 MAG: hypothetical protein A2513_04805 [Sulfurimonas sp. RIFOXYD12_FULL_33_39]OHE12772.1 MAG: hypothetical protein A2530_04000 [Sulfurimonas sp. RIFOXYD2_FULL_34_21]